MSETVDTMIAQQNMNQEESRRGLSDTFDDINSEYAELDSIAPLPLYLLMSVDDFSVAEGRTITCGNEVN